MMSNVEKQKVKDELKGQKAQIKSDAKIIEMALQKKPARPSEKS
jgi:hypothetical protein